MKHMRASRRLLVAASALAAGAVLAQDGAALAQKNQCLSCHKVEAPLVGPPFKEVGKRYKADADAVDKLVAKVRAGSRGAWGKVPMPPNKDVDEQELRAVLRWVLELG